MQQHSALILPGIDRALHRVILPRSTSLVRLRHLRFGDVVDGGDNMAVQSFERQHLEAAQELNMSEFGSCYPSSFNRPDGWPRSRPHVRSLRLHCMSCKPPFELTLCTDLKMMDMVFLQKRPLPGFFSTTLITEVILAYSVSDLPIASFAAAGFDCLQPSTCWRLPEQILQLADGANLRHLNLTSCSNENSQTEHE